ncbi:CdaA regulatory protein CdaR [Sporomusa silvacetica DSM 10669]|uniref:CdaA regulatory protein CdaR n=1 Tax=Sporomusa silvacetica DSM 10669 TaxID=1123289 RepID=A0ABZ3IFV0_9FIRM|nr:CdaR family protein [Sporomusa silvacetica]OZC13678.1 YbbR-like protein [Sporomusa silvacetica DSM 10669]
MIDNYFKKPGETKNIVPKILAIIMAIILWMYVMNEQNPPFESSFIIPLEVRNVAADYVLLDAPETVKVKIRGPRNMVAGVRTKDLKAFVDAKGLSEGSHSITVNVVIPSSLELVEISPDKVQLRLDPVISRQLSIEVRLTGTPAPGMVIGKAVPAHEQVTIEGPKNIVSTVGKVVAIVDLSGKNNDITADAVLTPINRADKEVEGLTIYPERVKITVNLTAAAKKKILDIKPVTQGELPPGLVIKSVVTEPNKVEITETAPNKGIDKLDAIYTESINLTDINKDTDKEAKLQLPEGMTGTTRAVIVKIKVGPR